MRAKTLQRTMPRALGLFHFRENFDDPIGRLRRELERIGTGRDIGGPLIVLPEAFNLGGSYYGATGTPGCARIPLVLALKELGEIARQWRIAFVVGLLEEQYSSAYWVDHRRESKWMCHKMGNDGRGHYIPWSDREGADGCNPLDFEDACVAALI